MSTPAEAALLPFQDIVGNTPQHRYRPVKAIGQGAYSNVWQLAQATTGRLLVGKFMDTTKMSEKDRGFALQEADNASKCPHPNIVEFVECVQREGKLLLVFEFADAGDLYAQVEVRFPSRFFKEPEILLILTQLCLALNQLHKRKMMHRDLKTPNVFLTMSGLIKLGDFGFSRTYDNTVSDNVGRTFCGTPYYLAPELWNQSPYSAKADMWSLGVVLYELMALRKPFSGNSMRELVGHVVSGRFDPLPNHYSPELTKLCQELLSVDPARRPSINEVLEREMMRTHGLLALLKNVPRLATVSAVIRQRIVEDVESTLAELGYPIQHPSGHGEHHQ